MDVAPRARRRALSGAGHSHIAVETFMHRLWSMSGSNRRPIFCARQAGEPCSAGLRASSTSSVRRTCRGRAPVRRQQRADLRRAVAAASGVLAAGDRSVGTYGLRDTHLS